MQRTALLKDLQLWIRRLDIASYGLKPRKFVLLLSILWGHLAKPSVMLLGSLESGRVAGF